MGKSNDHRITCGKCAGGENIVFGKLARFINFVIAFLFARLAKVARLFVSAGAMTKAVMEAVVLVIVIIMLDTYVIGNADIIDPEGTIGVVVVPILQAALLIAAILGAIAIIYFASTHSFSEN
jgi:hypothetical protein